jgi:hypothetical protein
MEAHPLLHRFYGRKRRVDRAVRRLVFQSCDRDFDKRAESGPRPPHFI